jgi:predicted glycoside hydrolase/deacetylase ChbG (UPF0249 family)
MTIPQNNSKKSKIVPQIGIVACADDFGLNAEVDNAIVDLVSQQRLTAVGALVDGPHIRQRALTLAGLETDVGLHLNFTEMWPGNPPTPWVMPWRNLVLKSYLGLLNAQQVNLAIEHQLDHFEAIFKRAPDFVDGHLHVHQLPGIRQPLLSILKRRYANHLPWLRDTRPHLNVSKAMPFWQRFKAQVIGFLGAQALIDEATTLNFKSNQGFVGAYDFSRPHPPFDQMLKIWLPTLQTGGLLMMHPSQQVLNNDPMGPSRVQEFTLLASPAWPELLAENHCKLVRLSQITSSLP